MRTGDGRSGSTSGGETKQEVFQMFAESLKSMDIDNFLSANFEEDPRSPQRYIVDCILKATHLELLDQEKRDYVRTWFTFVGLSAQNIRHLEICSINELATLLKISHTELRSLADRGRFDAEIKRKLMQSTLLLQGFFTTDPKKRNSLEDSPSTSNQSTPASTSVPSTSTVPSLVVSRFPQSSSMNFANTPKSPKTSSTRLVHAIPHKWHRSNKFRFRGGDAVCHFCQRPLGFGFLNAWEKCRSCRWKVHTQCKGRVGDSCGLTPDHLRFLFDKLIQENNGGMWNDPQSAIPLAGSRSMNEPAFQYPDNPIDSSSSTNSSAPSTPALPLGSSSSAGNSLNPLTGPFRGDRKFFFPENENPNMPKVPILVISEGDNHFEPKTDNAIESEGTIVGQDSVGSNDIQNAIEADKFNKRAEGGHQWERHTWNMSTIRGPNTQASWNEVTIQFEDIKFDKPVQVLGRGRFGNMLRGFHYGDVAVKLLNMDHVTDKSRRAEEFKLEVSAYKNTRHDNISLFLGYFMNNEQFGIVTSFCKGNQSLYTIIHVAKEKLELGTCRKIAQQICQGVSYLHTKKILHKDLRTKNVMIETINKVVITDFGIMSMKRLCYPKINYGYRTPKFWLSYAAPEIVTSLRCEFDDVYGEDLPFSESSDVYAFGTLWYEMLTGQIPFSQQEPHQTLHMKSIGISANLPSLSCTKEMKDLLTKCWNPDASGRPSFVDIASKLTTFPRKRIQYSPSFPVLMKSHESTF